MKVKGVHTFSFKNVDHFDIAIAMIYRGSNVDQFLRVKMTRKAAIRETVYANKVVHDFLRKV